jgi:hypothetical protein
VHGQRRDQQLVRTDQPAGLGGVLHGGEEGVHAVGALGGQLQHPGADRPEDAGELGRRQQRPGRGGVELVEVAGEQLGRPPRPAGLLDLEPVADAQAEHEPAGVGVGQRDRGALGGVRGSAPDVGDPGADHQPVGVGQVEAVVGEGVAAAGELARPRRSEAEPFDPAQLAPFDGGRLGGPADPADPDPDRAERGAGARDDVSMCHVR